MTEAHRAKTGTILESFQARQNGIKMNAADQLLDLLNDAIQERIPVVVICEGEAHEERARKLFWVEMAEGTVKLHTTLPLELRSSDVLYFSMIDLMRARTG